MFALQLLSLRSKPLESLHPTENVKAAEAAGSASWSAEPLMR
jgi:hypothetical protein